MLKPKKPFKFMRFKSMLKRYASIKQNQKGAAALLMLVLMLGSILTVTLTGAEIVRNGLKMSNIQYNSTKAYFAAEGGAERILYELRKPGRLDFDDCGENECVSFDVQDALTSNVEIAAGNDILCLADCTDSKVIQNYSNNTKFYLEYSTDAADIVVKSFGSYNDISGENINRVIELRY